MNRQEMESFLNAYSPFRNGSSNNSQSSGAVPQNNKDPGLQGGKFAGEFEVPDWLKSANLPIVNATKVLDPFGNTVLAAPGNGNSPTANSGSPTTNGNSSTAGSGILTDIADRANFNSDEEFYQSRLDPIREEVNSNAEAAARALGIQEGTTQWKNFIDIYSQVALANNEDYSRYNDAFTQLRDERLQSERAAARESASRRVPQSGYSSAVLATARQYGISPAEVVSAGLSDSELAAPTQEDWNNRVLLAMQKNGGSYEGAYNAIMQEEARIAQTMAMQDALRMDLIPNTTAFNKKVDELQQQYMMQSPDYIAAVSGLNDIRASRLAKDEAQKSAETQVQLTPASWLDPDVVSFNYMGY